MRINPQIPVKLYNPGNRGSEGYTPLMLACIGGHRSAVKFLLEHGAAVNATEHAQGNSALRFALVYGHQALFPLFVQHGATPEPSRYPPVAVCRLCRNRRRQDSSTSVANAGCDASAVNFCRAKDGLGAFWGIISALLTEERQRFAFGSSRRREVAEALLFAPACGHKRLLREPTRCPT